MGNRTGWVVGGILLAACASAMAEEKRVLLVGQGPDGHTPTTHEFMAGMSILEHLLSATPGVRARVANGGDPWSDGPDLIDACDGVVLFLSQGGQWMRTNPDRHAALERLALRRGGIVALHWAVGAKDAAFIDTSLRFIGACHGGPDRKYVKRDARVHVVQGHPIARGLGEWDVHDEFYYQLKRTLAEPGIEPILTTVIEGNEETAAWAWQRPDGGRSFGFVGLHFHRNWELEEYRRMVVQGVLWTLEVPIPAEGMKVDCPPELLALPAREKGASKVTR